MYVIKHTDETKYVRMTKHNPRKLSWIEDINRASKYENEADAEIAIFYYAIPYVKPFKVAK